MAAATSSSCNWVDTQDSSPPPAISARAGALLAHRQPSVAMVAVLDTKPEASADTATAWRAAAAPRQVRQRLHASSSTSSCTTLCGFSGVPHSGGRAPGAAPSAPAPPARCRRAPRPGAAIAGKAVHAALAQVRICSSVAFLREAMHRFVAAPARPRRTACAPATPLCACTPQRLAPGGRAAEPAELRLRRRPGPLRDHAHPARPVRRLLPGAVPPAAGQPRRRAGGGHQHQPIPMHFSFAEHDHVEGDAEPERRALMRDVFDLPDLTAMDDGIANGTHEPGPASAAAVAVHRAAGGLFAAAPAPLQRHRARLVPELRAVHQLPVLHRRVHQARPRRNGRPDSDYIAFVEPGNVVTRAGRPGAEAMDALGKAPPRLPQMPAYHLLRADRSGITMVNIGVGPATPRPSPTTSPCCARTPG
jgi:hypothetical protein